MLLTEMHVYWFAVISSVVVVVVFIVVVVMVIVIVVVDVVSRLTAIKSCVF